MFETQSRTEQNERGLDDRRAAPAAAGPAARLGRGQKRTSGQRAQVQLREYQAFFRTIVDRVGVGIARVDAQGRVVESNHALQEILRLSEQELRGLVLAELSPDEDARAEAELFRQLVTGGREEYRLEKRYFRKDGIPVWATVCVSPAEGSEPAFYIATLEDVTDRRAQAANLERLVLYDTLTDLPNRTLLRDRLQQAIQLQRRTTMPIALLVLDVNRFKEVNYTLGHQNGDLLLQLLARRLFSTVRETDTVARLGGGEFAVLLTAAGDVECVTRVVRRLLKALEQPLVVEGLALDIALSIGIALCPDHAQDADTLLRRADVAMYAAKQADSGFAVYAAEQDHYSPGRLALTAELRQAIEHGQLLLHYQPKIDLRTRRIDGVEALVRWQHPKRGLVPPDQFIPLAEQTGLIKPLTEWVLNAALQQCHVWHQAGLEVPIAVNLSARNLLDTQLPVTVAEMLTTWELPPAWLKLELTESAVMANPARAVEVLGRLRAMGVRMAIDDFGTGYSSLGYLKQLLVDELKVDRSFVMDMVRDDNDAAIVRSTIELGHTLGLEVVAEGVEDQATWELLGTLGCDIAQGYYMSRPMPGSELPRWLGESSWRAATPDAA